MQQAIARLIACFCAFGAAGPLAATAQDLPVVTLAFPDMAPYLVRDPDTGAAEGAIVTRVSELAEAAGVQIRWVGPMPRARIWAGMEAKRPVCHPNARKTPDRERRFKMTEPIFGAAEYRVVFRRGVDLREHPTLASMLLDDRLIFGRKLGSILSPDVEKVIQGKKKGLESVRGSLIDLIRMLANGRVHYIVADVSDFEATVRSGGWKLEEFEMLDLPDLPRSQAGRIVCSLAIPDTVIDAFNTAIRALPNRPDRTR